MNDMTTAFRDDRLCREIMSRCESTQALVVGMPGRVHILVRDGLRYSHEALGAVSTEVTGDTHAKETLVPLYGASHQTQLN